MYLEKIIGNQYRNWKSGEWIFISAPTGTGKTTFVLNQLVPEAQNAGKEVLFLSNRTILRDQVKNIVARRQGIDADMRFLKEVEEFDGITLMSYQKIQALMENTSLYSWFDVKRYMYVIFDEAHYILEDSTFNAKVIYIEKFIKGCCCTKIFMSATIQEVRSYILENYLQSKIIEASEQQVTPYITSIPLKTYTSSIGLYSYLWMIDVPQYTRNAEIKYFDSYNQIVDKINKSGTKWIIFSSNKGKVGEWKNRINRSYEIVSADDKEKSIITEIISSEKFSTEVLITTKLLDNGVNFKDENLKNLVIDTISEVEFVQMVGRKRLKEGEKITIYIPKKTKMFFIGYDNLHFSKILKVLESNIQRRTFVQEVLDDSEMYDIVRRFFIYSSKKQDVGEDAEGGMVLNIAGLYKVRRLNAFVKRMEEKLQTDKYAFVKAQLQWLGVDESFDQENDLTLENRKTILDALKNYLTQLEGEELDKNLQAEFRKIITEFMHNSEYEFKAGRVAGKSAINEFFKKMQINYVVDVRKAVKKGDATKWFIRRKRDGVAC